MRKLTSLTVVLLSKTTGALRWCVPAPRVMRNGDPIGASAKADDSSSTRSSPASVRISWTGGGGDGGGVDGGGDGGGCDGRGSAGGGAAGGAGGRGGGEGSGRTMKLVGIEGSGAPVGVVQ